MFHRRPFLSPKASRKFRKPTDERKGSEVKQGAQRYKNNRTYSPIVTSKHIKEELNIVEAPLSLHSRSEVKQGAQPNKMITNEPKKPNINENTESKKRKQE